MASIETMIPRKDWKLYNTDDIGPLEYVNRFNGGALSFKYIKSTKTLTATNRGVYSPYCYQLHSGGRKDKHIGLFYKFNINGISYYCSRDDAIGYLPEALPEEYVDCNTVNNINNIIDSLINNIYLSNKHIAVIENEIDYLDNVINFNIITTNTKQTIFSFIKHNDDRFLLKFYSNNELLYVINIQNKRELQTAIEYIYETLDSNEYIKELIEICNVI